MNKLPRFSYGTIQKKKSVMDNFDLKTSMGHYGTEVPKPKDALLNLRGKKNRKMSLESPHFGTLNEVRTKPKTSNHRKEKFQH